MPVVPVKAITLSGLQALCSARLQWMVMKPIGITGDGYTHLHHRRTSCLMTETIFLTMLPTVVFSPLLQDTRLTVAPHLESSLWTGTFSFNICLSPWHTVPVSVAAVSARS